MVVLLVHNVQLLSSSPHMEKSQNFFLLQQVTFKNSLPNFSDSLCCDLYYKKLVSTIINAVRYIYIYS